MIRILSVVLAIVVVAMLGVYFPYLKFYDRTHLDKKIQTFEDTVPSLEKLESYLDAAEKKYPRLRQGLGKSVTWFDDKIKQQTEYSFIYMPGFTATRKEISPVVEVLAHRFHANSFFSRLPSHGEEADDFSNASTAEFFENAMEAVVIGQRIGKKPIFIGLSTGATVLQFVLNRTKAGFAFVGMSPAFYSPWHYMNVSLNPWVGRPLVKLVVGDYYQWTGRFAHQDLYWNTKYNTDILPELTRVFQIASQEDYSQMATPYFLIYNPKDSVADPKLMVEKWEQTTSPFKKSLTLESRDSHVIAGDITSPENTNRVIDEIAEWIGNIK